MNLKPKKVLDVKCTSESSNSGTQGSRPKTLYSCLDNPELELPNTPCRSWFCICNIALPRSTQLCCGFGRHTDSHTDMPGDILRFWVHIVYPRTLFYLLRTLYTSRLRVCEFGGIGLQIEKKEGQSRSLMRHLWV